MKVSRSLKIWSLFAMLSLLFSAAYADVDAGYEAANGVPGTCPSGSNTPDAFGGIDSQNNQLQGFYACNCTSYVAYRLRLNDVKLHKNQTGSDELFVNHNWGNTTINWSDAWKWGDDAKLDTVGIHKDQYPAVGSVAYWDTDKIPGTGHVAYVQHLFTHPNDGRITGIGVMEYNWSPKFQYRYRRMGHGRGDEYPTSFLHFEEKGRDADDTNATCVTGLSVKPFEDTHDGSFCWVHNGDDADCESASEYYYFDYRTCERHNVSSEGNYSPSEYCDRVGSNPGYTAHIGNWFPESIAPSANGTDFASCPQGGTGTGNSREVSGRLPKERKKFLQKASGNG